MSTSDVPDTGSPEGSSPASPAGPASPASSAGPAGIAGTRYGRRRRAPRYGSFLATGALVGIVLGVVLSFSRPATGQFSQNSVVGYVAATLGLLGALLGAAVAILLDRRRS
jgi:hypothetical protein